MENAASPAHDAWLALRLFAIDPALAGGVVLRSAAGPVRDLWLSAARALLPAGAAWRVVPAHVDADRLLGGLDLAATLNRGQVVAQRGLLSEADGGVVVLAMAERCAASTVAHVNAALDTGTVQVARDGVESSTPSRFAVIALDESTGDEAVAASLADRLAWHVDLGGVSLRDAEAARDADADAAVESARQRGHAGDCDEPLVEALCQAAVALGVPSLRASVLAVRVARLSAMLFDRAEPGVDDAALAARLVLAPRATRLPSPGEAASEAPDDAADDASNGPDDGPNDDASPPDASADSADDSPADPVNADTAPPTDDDRARRPDAREASADDVVLDAATAAIPAGLLARLQAGALLSTRHAAAGRAGALQQSGRQGRPLPARRGPRRAGARLDLVATLRAAAPWQRLRRAEVASASDAHASDALARPLVLVRAADFHIARRVQRGRTTTIFAVDASGSSALHRLAEAKGAVELMLAECYVRRDSVAVIAFRGRGSELLLPPTRSLARAKRSLAELPGGGGTPLASGIDAAAALAISVRRRGDMPVIVVLTDGRANVDRDGQGGRERADRDALAAARALRAEGLAAILIDTSPQPQARARDMAAAMQALYLPLPHAGAAVLNRAVQAASAGVRPQPG